MPTNPISILFIHHGSGIGGAPISLLNLIKHLNKEKYKVKVAFLKDSKVVDMFRENGIPVEILGMNSHYFSLSISDKLKWFYFYQYFRIAFFWIKTAFLDARNYLQKQDADIVHLNSHVLTSWAFAAKKLDYKVVMHNREAISRGNIGIRFNLLKRLIRLYVDAIIHISKDNESRLGLYKNSNVIYNFVDIPDSYNLPMRDSKNVKVIYLGGQSKIKGFSTVVAALQHLNPSVTLYFAGNFSNIEKKDHLLGKLKYVLKRWVYRRRIYRLVFRIKESKNAIVLGLLKYPLKTINDCDILITPFYNPHFSRPAIEAMAYGKPVIGSNVQGMDEIIINNETGIIIPKGDSIALAEAINFLSANPQLAIEMGRKGRKRAKEMFSPKVNVKKVEEIYNNLCNKM